MLLSKTALQGTVVLLAAVLKYDLSFWIRLLLQIQRRPLGNLGLWIRANSHGEISLIFQRTQWRISQRSPLKTARLSRLDKAHYFQGSQAFLENCLRPECNGLSFMFPDIINSNSHIYIYILGINFLSYELRLLRDIRVYFFLSET